MKTVFLGSGQFGIDSLNALLGSSHSPLLVIAQPPRPAGRARKTRPTPAACWAKENSVACIEPENVNKPEIVEKIAQLEPDVIVVAAFGQKIGNEIIALPPKGTINIHASLLPKYRGAAPINWAIINGEHETGISIITVVEKMDAGEVLAQAQTSIGPFDTAGRLHDRLAALASPLLLETLDEIAAGTATYTPQDHSGATVAPKLKKSDGLLDFGEPARALQRRIRGLWPWPGASAEYVSNTTGKSQRVAIAMAEVVESSNPAHVPSGTLDGNLNVICGKDALKITKIKPAGGTVMDFEAFVNGRATQPGDAFAGIVDRTKND